MDKLNRAPTAGLPHDSRVRPMGLERPLFSLPNQDGFQFIGILYSGMQALCVIRRNPTTGRHQIAGGATYGQLRGWKTVKP